MAISNCSGFCTRNPNFGPKYTDVTKNILTIESFLFRYYEYSYTVLVEYQKLVVKGYPIKS